MWYFLCLFLNFTNSKKYLMSDLRSRFCTDGVSNFQIAKFSAMQKKWEEFRMLWLFSNKFLCRNMTGFCKFLNLVEPSRHKLKNTPNWFRQKISLLMFFLSLNNIYCKYIFIFKDVDSSI